MQWASCGAHWVKGRSHTQLFPRSSHAGHLTIGSPGGPLWGMSCRVSCRRQPCRASCRAGGGHVMQDNFVVGSQVWPLFVRGAVMEGICRSPGGGSHAGHLGGSHAGYILARTFMRDILLSYRLQHTVRGIHTRHLARVGSQAETLSSHAGSNVAPCRMRC
jgi:hypothetical protein